MIQLTHARPGGDVPGPLCAQQLLGGEAGWRLQWARWWVLNTESKYHSEVNNNFSFAKLLLWLWERKYFFADLAIQGGMLDNTIYTYLQKEKESI